ncbi:MAG: hypothetical protein J4F35_03590 [Candidatus Latescibacteria bacterium]|nr:hypothetical protein [Candidatus Latescibacterota bacterium]
METHAIRRVDIAVYSPDRKLQLVVEIKNKLGASTEWVTRMRHNLLTHSFIPHVPYFLLVLPDFFHLWRDTTPMNSLAKPDYEIEAAKILAPYLKPTRSLNNLRSCLEIPGVLRARAKARRTRRAKPAILLNMGGFAQRRPPCLQPRESHQGFSDSFYSWLEDIVRTDLQQNSVDPNLQWLFDSGLYEAIAHGSVAIEDTV